jgi:hypothetical protein
MSFRQLMFVIGGAFLLVAFLSEALRVYWVTIDTDAQAAIAATAPPGFSKYVTDSDHNCSRNDHYGRDDRNEIYSKCWWETQYLWRIARDPTVMSKECQQLWYAGELTEARNCDWKDDKTRISYRFWCIFWSLAALFLSLGLGIWWLVRYSRSSPIRLPAPLKSLMPPPKPLHRPYGGPPPQSDEHTRKTGTATSIPSRNDEPVHNPDFFEKVAAFFSPTSQPDRDLRERQRVQAKMLAQADPGYPRDVSYPDGSIFRITNEGADGSIRGFTVDPPPNDPTTRG